MDNTSTIALSRLIAQENAMDVRANNIANANTPGFKASKMLFTQFLSRQNGGAAPRGGGTIAYTEDHATYRDASTGPITQTGNPLDLALTNNGYFQLQTANGIRLSRNGHFELAADGTITDTAGDALLDDGGNPLKLAPTDTDPTVSGDGTLSGASGAIGKIGVVTPNNPLSLTAEGNSLLAFQGGTSAVASPSVSQGAIEGSNVEAVAETSGMMNDLREFQFVTQMIQAENHRQQDAIDKIASPSQS